jgi:hypothetical protein
MPYADPAEQAEFMRTLYARRYQDDPEFRADEAFRKKVWYYRNQEKVVAAYRKKRKKIRASRKMGRSGEMGIQPELAVLSGYQSFPVLL